MRTRYYDPAVGRFLTQDIYPVDYSNPLELNRYVYVANNPVNATDPSGLQLASTAQLNAYTVATAGALVALYFAFCPFCQQQLWQAIDELLVDRIEDAFQNLLETLSGRRHEVHSGTETRTETRADEEDDEVWRVRHYSIDIVAIMSGGVIKSRGGIPSLTVYVEYPPEMPRTAEILEARHFHFTLRRNQLSGVVEFDVDLSKWTVTEDPSFAGERRAWIIHIPVEIWHRGAGGFPLTPDINPEFYNANGNRIG